MTEEEEKKLVVAMKKRSPISRGSAECEVCGETVYYSDDWENADVEIDGFICRECQLERVMEEDKEDRMFVSEETVEHVNEMLGTDYDKEDLMEIAKDRIGSQGVKKIMEEEETGGVAG